MDTNPDHDDVISAHILPHVTLVLIFLHITFIILVFSITLV